MSLNGYTWVEGNVPNMADPTGLQGTCAALGSVFGTICGAVETVANEADDIVSEGSLSGIASAIGSVATPTGVALGAQLVAFSLYCDGI